MTNVQILDRQPELYLDELRTRCPEITFRTAGTSAELEAGLAAATPCAGFAIGDNGFARSGQRALYQVPGLEFFQVGGSGYEQVLPFDNPGCTVANCAGVLAGHLAETVTGAMLALNGHFFQYHERQKRGLWHNIPFRPLEEQTLLVVGLGAIGSRVAHNAKALGMRVLATRNAPARHPKCDAVRGPDALGELLAEADIVSLHVRLDETTRHMMNAASIASMKPGAILINTARGGCVDTSALMQALESGHVRAAYLDVFEQEPLPEESPVWSTPNLFATPHCADMIDGWQVKFARFFADNLERHLKGEELANIVARSTT